MAAPPPGKLPTALCACVCGGGRGGIPLHQSIPAQRMHLHRCQNVHLAPGRGSTRFCNNVIVWVQDTEVNKQMELTVASNPCKLSSDVIICSSWHGHVSDDIAGLVVHRSRHWAVALVYKCLITLGCLK